MLSIPAPGSDYEGWCRILTAGDDGAVYSWTDEDGDIFTMDDGTFETFAPLVPDFTDAGTGGCCVTLLGPEAWRVRYSPSMHKRAAGVPWVADLVGTVTVHATQGEACVAVAEALGRWGGA
jgi:hypothetical protein